MILPWSGWSWTLIKETMNQELPSLRTVWEHQSVCVSICSCLYPLVSIWKGKLQQLTPLLTDKNGGEYLGNARKEWECEIANPSLTGGVLSPFAFILYKWSPTEWSGFRADFKESILRKCFPVFLKCRETYSYYLKTRVLILDVTIFQSEAHQYDKANMSNQKNLHMENWLFSVNNSLMSHQNLVVATIARLVRVK